jgi:hypothetical protein
LALVNTNTPLREFNQIDQIDRERWSVAAAYAIASCADVPTLHAIVAGGEDEFIRVARQNLSGHSFHLDDYKRIYHMLVRRAAKVTPHA